MQAPPCCLAVPVAGITHLPDGRVISIQKVVACKAKALNEQQVTLHTPVSAAKLQSNTLHHEPWTCLQLLHATIEMQHDRKVGSGILRRSRF